ncbi:hypothetical protein QCA50_000114 [Cerrena zonata]|uniref:RlpA-like protein double-psi beta-barrel domain-containing protein n=1 Tax=Cerrena zonata TaxID=2478898 RepID=A0AAW0GXB3_9APHY
MSNPTYRRNTLALVLAAFFLLSNLVLGTSALDLRSFHDSLEARYTRAHSLGDNYQFDPRDGWQTVNASNLQYKYDDQGGDELDGRDEDEELAEDTEETEEPYYNSTLAVRADKKKATNPKKPAKSSKASKVSSKSKAKAKPKSKSAASSVTSNLGSIINSFKAVGKPEPVTITWYTGHDLENPSCWSNPTWAPTDASFACALTLEGWTTRPKCFKFLELCSTVKQCVFVRVVDSCAGCKKGSKHVDLTQAAFKQLAGLDQGLLTVNMRQATDPDGWLENLWGPKA